VATITHELDPSSAILRSSAFPQLVQANGTNIPVRGLAFDASTEEACFFPFIATSYGSGNVTVNVYWYADTASSGDVIWGSALAAITANTDSQDIETDSLATASTSTDTHLGTTGQRLHHIAVTISNLDSLAAGDYVALQVYRDADAGGDTMTGDAILVALTVTYSDT
jgi:hypothetical protein